jgi:uncharacterized repeat protein (TIGR03843 family)
VSQTLTADDLTRIWSKDEILSALAQGEMDLEGQFVISSNYTFLAALKHGDTTIRAVYKPCKGEMPLWDFPPESLARRETAAYLVSEALGWELVPPTTLRKKGPFGAGSLQLYVPHQPDLHYFSFDEATRQQLRPTAAFDLLVNNADRKGSHILLDDNGHIWLIDHGLTFHADPKLRTVVWDFIGEAIPAKLCSDIEGLLRQLEPGQALHRSLLQLLHQGEISALANRCHGILVHPVFPAPHHEKRQYPWPLV